MREASLNEKLSCLKEKALQHERSWSKGTAV